MLFVSGLLLNFIIQLGEDQEVKHLGVGTFGTPAFPVNGIIHGTHSRFMVPLVCQRANKPNSKAINVWFLLDTGSLFTCLTVKTLEVFFGAGNVTSGKFYSFALQVCFHCIYYEYFLIIQDQSSRIECQVSKIGSHFEHVNILGVDSMQTLGLSAIRKINWKGKTFCLDVE